MNKLGEFFSLIHGWAFKGEFFSETGTQSILTPGNFYEKGGFKYNEEKDRFYTGEYPLEYLCKKGDLIVAMTEQAAGLLGSTAIVPQNNRYLHNQRIGLIECNKAKLLPLYAYYLFMTKSVREQISRSASGTKVKHTSPEKIYDVEVSIPDIKRQHAVSSFLWSLDSKIQSNLRICRELDDWAQVLYNYWFTQFDFPDADGKPYRSSGGAMEWNEQLKRQVPKDWDIGNLGSLGTITSGGTPSTSNNSYYTENGIAWITPNDLSGNEHKLFFAHGERDITRDGLNNSSAVLMPRGTVLFSSRAPIGYIAISENEVCSNQGFKSIVPDKGFGSVFVYYTLKRNTPAIAKQGVGTTFKEVSRDTMERFKIVLPPVSITERFEHILHPLVEKRRSLEHENMELTKLRDWLLPMLMNGQATVK